MITSEAGTRLAKAYAALDAIEPTDGETEGQKAAVLAEYVVAARQVALELIEQGFHEMEGD